MAIWLVLRSGCCDRNISSLLLTGTSWDLNNAAVKQESMSGPSDDSSGSRVSHMFLFFSFVFQSLSNSLRALRDSAVGKGKRRIGKLDRDISLRL